jgi:hypothetical protein
MHQEAVNSRGSTMTSQLIASELVASRVWIQEHEWLHAVFKNKQNQSPKFRYPDLLSACIALTLNDPHNVGRLRAFLRAELSQRDPRSLRRTCHVWKPQFDALLAEHRAAWNDYPNPKFELDAIATGCVAVSRASASAVEQIVQKAREQLTSRSSTSSNA